MQALAVQTKSAVGVHICPQRAQRHKVGVNSPSSDDVAAGSRQMHLACPGKHRSSQRN